MTTSAAAPRNHVTQVRDFVAHVLNQASRPEMLEPVCSPTEPLVTTPSALERLPAQAALHASKCLTLAEQLRERVRIQALAAVSVMASPLLVDESKLFDLKTKTRRKPRVIVWAELGEDQALNVFWRPLRSEYPEMPIDNPAYCETTDYISMGSTPAFHEDVPDNQILRLERTEFLHKPGTRRSATRPLTATWEVARALDESLRGMLDLLGTFCDIRLEAWPTYDEGALVLFDEGDRAYALLSYALEEGQQQLAVVSKRGASLVRTFGFDCFDEWQALVACSEETVLRRELSRRRGAAVSLKQTREMVDIADTAEALREACVSFGEAIAYMEKEFLEGLRNLG